MDGNAPMSTCPKCGKRYVQRNMRHSCGDHTVEQFLAGEGTVALALWQRLVDLVAGCGPFDFHAAKTRIGFIVLVRFAGISALSDRARSLHFWLKRRIGSSRFARVDHLGGRDWVYRVRIERLEDLDDEVRRWLCEGYEVGCRRC